METHLLKEDKISSPCATTEFWERTFCCFPMYVFSSSLRASRRSRLWRAANVKTERVFYGRDKTGDIWLFVVESLENFYSFNAQILGYPVKELTEENVRECFARKCCRARIDTQVYNTARNCLVIVDTLVHPDYRRRHVSSLLVRAALEFFESKGFEINKLTGKLGAGDESTEQDREARNSFWQALGFTIDESSKRYRRIYAEKSNLKFDRVKATKITEREYTLEVEGEVWREIAKQLIFQSDSFGKGKSCLQGLLKLFYTDLTQLSDS